MKRVGLLLAVLSVALAGAPGARAFYGKGATLISADPERSEQGDDASTFSAISDDARFVAFQTRARNLFGPGEEPPPAQDRLGGIFRTDLATGALELVAAGDTLRRSDGVLLFRGAENPAISADGRYVAFSTGERLSVADVNDNIDVYLRDMSYPVTSTAAFELVSARDGNGTPAHYAPPPAPRPGANPGSDVWPGAAISDGGRRVVFRTVEVASDLPSRPSIDTPGDQLFVRDLDAETTTLVTRQANPPPGSDPAGAPAGGAIGPAGISGDGSTVAWTGYNAAAQTRFLPGEQIDETRNFYLWRRLADGPGAPTRRITGLSDPDDPSCPPGGSVGTDPTATGPCYGPLTDNEEGRNNLSVRLPSLSRDGWKVAFVVGAGPRPNNATPPGLDVYVTDMTPGRSRKAATRELTREGAPGDLRAQGQIESASLSADGRRIALVTTRAAFVLPGLSPIGTFRKFSDVDDLYLVDLDRNTVERVTRGFDGGDSTGNTILGATPSADGARLAFASVSGNLFFGDSNEKADAFVATRMPDPGDDPGTELPPLPPEQAPPVRRLRVAAEPTKGGSLRLTVRVPESGAVDAQATASRKDARSGGKRRSRRIAAKRGNASGAGVVRLTLRPSKSYRSLLRRKRRLPASIAVSLEPAAPSTRLRASLRAVFLLQRR